jgi:LPXTG-motif cell wall-anchored protein
VADSRSTTSSPVLPLVAVGVGALFLGGGIGLLWMRRRRLPPA